MEVAGQWRRQWAGTAEYGKVTAGGVTRQVARAMEVLHASSPGARVRVMRAAYHESAGPGAPAASFLMHASRRVISSGFNLLEPPSFTSINTKPLEISSTPLESSPERAEGEDYKVTEPDDFEISEPSKWRSSTGGTSVRMPSEESSSTDNASIIDLDSRNHKNILRKYSYDSENSDVPTFRRNSARQSPLLDAPVALSTLKYKSLLNGSNDWNNRRKSYSFEDSPLSETITHSNDTLAMESSTDSGICKSTEIVDYDDKYFDKKDRKYDKDDTFKGWLSRNRSSSFSKGNQGKPYRLHDVVLEDPLENNIALQSKGKVTITVPITVESDEDCQLKKNREIEEADRKAKKVEFCKTEVHFAADSGKVDIIATDEKPPPSNDFRKRKSAFVPINGNFDKPITLFGESNQDLLESDDFSRFNRNETDFDENTAATKSILKNKIPKPKPYLLGENMDFGRNDLVNNNDDYLENSAPLGVALVNRRLKSEKRQSDSLTKETDKDVIRNDAFRTSNKGSDINGSFNRRNVKETEETISSTSQSKSVTSDSSIKDKLQALQITPAQVTQKTRQLRESDLTYFGLENPKKSDERRSRYENRIRTEGIDDIFQSVKLIQQVSQSLCNSEAESEDSHEYQNLPVRSNFAPVPTPRSRGKFDETKETRLNAVLEQEDNENHTSDTRRSRVRRQDSYSNRSISEPPKNRYCSIENPRRKHDQNYNVIEKVSPSQRPDGMYTIRDKINTDSKHTNSVLRKKVNSIVIDNGEPTYINMKKLGETTEKRTDSIRRRTEQLRASQKKVDSAKRNDHKVQNIRSTNNNNYNSYEKKDAEGKEKQTTHRVSEAVSKNNQEEKKHSIKRTKVRTEKLTTPEYTGKHYDKRLSTQRSKTRVEKNEAETPKLEEHRSKSTQQQTMSNKTEKDTLSKETKVHKLKDLMDVGASEREERKHEKSRQSSKERVNDKHEKYKMHSDTQHSSINSKTKLNITEAPLIKSEYYKTPKRREYVINYDDKNGTVSSICKVKPVSSSSKKKKIFKELKESPKEQTINPRTSDKSYLLQFPEREWDPYGLSYADKKRKRKMHVQRSCQLL